MELKRRAQDNVWIACGHILKRTANDVGLHDASDGVRCALCIECARQLRSLPPEQSADVSKAARWAVVSPEALAKLLPQSVVVFRRQLLNRDLLRQRRQARRDERRRAEHNSSPRRQGLPLLTADDCRGCGACCRHVGHPMFIRPLAAAAETEGWYRLWPDAADALGRQYASERHSQRMSERAWILLPIHLKQEIIDYWTQLGREVKPGRRDGLDDYGEPCFWLDAHGTCRHHRHRPAVCEDFEVGGEACRRFVRESRQEDQS
jgi:Fe-S-cluster containining protein